MEMNMVPVMLTKDEIERLLKVYENEIRFTAHINNLPYIPLLPSLRAYALIDYQWSAFVHEYKQAVIIAVRSGQNFAYID